MVRGCGVDGGSVGVGGVIGWMDGRTERETRPCGVVNGVGIVVGGVV